MWILLALFSALCLGFYDICKKLSVRDNNVLLVLWLSTCCGTVIFLPWIIIEACHGSWGLGNTLTGHLFIVLKSAIVLGSWVLGYFALKHLPLTVQAPINSSRPILVLVGALLIFGERLSPLQWIGVVLGFISLYMISRIGAKEGGKLKNAKWVWLSIASTALGAVSALYDKHLMRHFDPLDVQAWFTFYQCLLMGLVILLILRPWRKGELTGGKLQWRWSIPLIAIFLAVADGAYFYALSKPESMISIVSMIRRGSVIVSFGYGFLILREKHIRAKLIVLGVLLLSLVFLILGS